LLAAEVVLEQAEAEVEARLEAEAEAEAVWVAADLVSCLRLLE